MELVIFKTLIGYGKEVNKFLTNFKLINQLINLKIV